MKALNKTLEKQDSSHGDEKGMKALRTIILIFVFGIFSVSGVNAVSSGFSSGVTVGGSYTNYNQGFSSYYSSGDIATYWPILSDRDNCLARQDVLLQVTPAGCQPTVVRSDILAEQNVPVFCQVDALTLNPIIDIKEIKGIRFSGNYPKEVAGTGFHPAQAAINTRDTLLGNPVINNIGYAVIILRRNQNESSLPDTISVNLTGIIDYDIENALGVGTAEFVLEPTSDSQWADDSVKNKNSFWQGRYFVRLLDADENYANVAIYSGDALMNVIKVKRGETSREIYLSGFYCKAALMVSYDGFVEQDLKATIEVGDSESTDVVQLYKGSRFLNGKCSIVDIIPNKLRSDAGNVTVNCNGQRIDLQLRIPGSALFDIFKDDKGKVVTPEIQNFPELSIKLGVDIQPQYSVNLGTKGTYVLFDGKLYGYTDKESNIKEITDLSVKNGVDLAKLKQALIEYKNVAEQKDEGIASGLIDEQYGGDKDKAFNDAISAYEKVAEDYPSEKTKSDDTAQFYGSMALEGGIDLAKDFSKWQTAARLITKYIKLYPGNRASNYKGELNNYNIIDPSKSSNVIYVDNKYRTIRLLSIEQPAKRASADLTWGGATATINKGEVMKSGKNNITVDYLISADSARVTTRCIEGKNERVITNTLTLRVDQIENVCGQSLKLDRVNLERVAKIRLTPNVKGTRTETNLSVTIGIEKRAIQLNPEETMSRIENLNKSIIDFERISDKLGEVVKGLKATCLATATVLNIANFVTGMDGTASARQQVMRGAGGWNEKCQEEINKGVFQTLTQCFNKHSGEIESTVKEKAKAMEQVNQKLKDLENAPGVTTQGSGLFGEDYVDRNKAVTSYREYLLRTYPNEKFKDPYTNKELTIEELLSEKGYQNGEYSYEQLRDLHTDILMKKSGNEVAGSLSSYDSWTIASQIKDNQDLVTTNINTQKWAKNGLPYSTQIMTKNQNNVNAQVAQVTDDMRTKYFPQDKDKKVQFMSIVTAPIASTAPQNSRGAETTDFGKAAPYALGLAKSSAGTSGYGVIAVTKLKEDESGGAVADALGTVKGTGEVDTQAFVNAYSIGTVTAVADISCMNRYKNAKIKYYSNSPYEGMPALVPFDLNRGWYVATKPVLSGFGNIGTYKSSGEVNSFYVCNVGRNGMEQFLEGARDDICQLINTGTGQSLNQFSCLSENEGRKLINDAMLALQQASEQKGNSLVNINVGGRGSVSVKPEATTSAPATQCTDTMSANNCKILFNVCDPVICPASRCNLGGQYQVSDVIQSGVVGSLLLCLPNAREGVMIPVCLTGIKAGLDAYLSLLKGQRDCLQESLNSSQMVGICDEIYSIYACEFFWSQFAPVANNILPKMIEVLSGKAGARGGGEYQNVAAAWSNAEKSVDYFTQTYAINSMEAFRIRGIEDAGTMFCKAYISGVGPNMFDSLIEPDSPSQFYARFDTFKFSDATVPATSQYKVFYHIYAGNDQGVYYSVYLKNPPQTSYYYSASQIMVANGFISKGQYKSETRDFTAPEGYKELCVRINDKEECGFGQVSTDFAVNYVSDYYAAQQVNQTGITSQKDCISGGADLSNLLNPNLQAGLNDVVDSNVYNRGIVRVCATQNPGRSTDPTRYVDVGFCDDTTMRCWLDKNSVSNAIGQENIGVTNATLQSLKNTQIDALVKSGDLYGEGDANSVLKGLDDAKTALEKNYDGDTASLLLQKIDAVTVKLYINHHKARAYLIKAQVKAIIATDARNKVASTATKTIAPTTTTTTTAEGTITLAAADSNGNSNILFDGQETGLYINRNKAIYYLSDIDAIGKLRVDNTVKLEDDKMSPDAKESVVYYFGNNNYNKLISAAGMKISGTVSAASISTEKPETTVSETNVKGFIVKDLEDGGFEIYNGQNLLFTIDSSGIVSSGEASIGEINENGVYVLKGQTYIPDNLRTKLEAAIGNVDYNNMVAYGFKISSSSGQYNIVIMNS